MHPPLAARNVFHAATTTWLPGTVHSRISSLSRRLTRPRVAPRYDTQLGLPATLNNALARAGAVLAVPLFGRLTISRRQAWAIQSGGSGTHVVALNSCDRM